MWRMAAGNGQLCAKFGLKPYGSTYSPSDIICDFNVTYEDGPVRVEGKLEVVPASGSKLDGMNLSGLVCDEIHSYESYDSYHSLEGSMGTRVNPLILAITTAGSNVTGIGFEMYSLAKKVLNKEVIDESFFCGLWHIDQNDDWTNEKVWPKANPSLELMNMEGLRSECQRATMSVQARQSFLTKKLNVFSTGGGTWIDERNLDACQTEIDWSQFKGKPAWIGIDLSQVNDLSCMAYVFNGINDDYLYVMLRAYLPLEVVKSNTMYLQWAEDGWLTPLAGNVVNYNAMKNQVISDENVYELEQIAYDTWHASQLALELEAEGLDLLAVTSKKKLGETLGKLESMFIGKKIRYDSPILKWCLSNCIIKIDSKENASLGKLDDDQKIDAADGLMYASYAKFITEVEGGGQSDFAMSI